MNAPLLRRIWAGTRSAQTEHAPHSAGAMRRRLLEGVRQSELRGITCIWGPHEQRHGALIPFFRADYKVFGFIGFSLGIPPVWYPGTPAYMDERGTVLRFKDSYAPEPPPLPTLEPDLFDGACFHDPWGALAGWLMADARFPSLSGALDLAEHKLRGKPIADLLYEASLHRLRGFVFKRWVLWEHHLSTLQVPNLGDVIKRIVDDGNTVKNQLGGGFLSRRRQAARVAAASGKGVAASAASGEREPRRGPGGRTYP